MHAVHHTAEILRQKGRPIDGVTECGVRMRARDEAWTRKFGGHTIDSAERWAPVTCPGCLQRRVSDGN